MSCALDWLMWPTMRRHKGRDMRVLLTRIGLVNFIFGAILMSDIYKVWRNTVAVHYTFKDASEKPIYT